MPCRLRSLRSASAKVRKAGQPAAEEHNARRFRVVDRGNIRRDGFGEPTAGASGHIRSARDKGAEDIASPGITAAAEEAKQATAAPAATAGCQQHRHKPHNHPQR